jgi:ubiquinone/menaquinone biosynthesis C-methylase UbiE
MAMENAGKEGVHVDFRKGDAAAMPFADETFDAIVCRAAFKNFANPMRALDEMHRVWKPGAFAVIIDLNKNASPGLIAEAVKEMQLGLINRRLTQLTFKFLLLKRAYRPEDMQSMAEKSHFRSCDLRLNGIGFEAYLSKLM